MKRTREAQTFLNRYRASTDAEFTEGFDAAVRAELVRLYGYAIHHFWCYGTDDTDERCECGLRELRRYVFGGGGASDAEGRQRAVRRLRREHVEVSTGDADDAVSVET